MSKLTTQEIEALLIDLSPSTIRQLHADRLDEHGDALLEREQQELDEVDRYLIHLGEQFPLEAPPVPEAQLPIHFNPPSQQVWWRRSRPVSNGLIGLAAAVFAGMFVLLLSRPSREAEEAPRPEVVRQVPVDAGLDPYDSKLVDALWNRGNHLMALGDKLGDQAYYQAALRDLSRAHELKPSHRGVVAQLALVYEKLGDDDQAQSFLQKLEAMPP